MGSVNKYYCDLCAVEMYTPSAHIHMYEQPQSNTTVTDLSRVQVCGTCRGKLLTWLESKKSAADEQWKPAEPVVEEITAPEV